MIKDSYYLTDSPPSGPDNTFNGFKNVVGSRRIDYVFVHNEISVIEHSTLKIREGEVFISDHWPVMTRLIIK